ncbi:hypothetical protein QUB08_14590 [Microcoleus sp. BR0-C5]|uniref:hypothetical protein n=1 Tax=Microcoleus sp. BR0-C5 TaxID=2818713 RepID=UPI002FD1ED5F
MGNNLEVGSYRRLEKINLRSRFYLDTFLFKRAIVLLASVNFQILEFDLNHNSPLTVASPPDRQGMNSLSNS